MDHPVLDHEGPWTEDDYLTLTRPSGDGRVELVDGALIVGPGITPQRTRVLAAVRAVIEEALPDGLRLLGPVPLRLGPDCLLVPDLVLVRAVPAPADEPAGAEAVACTAAPGAVLDAADALMVVEVVGFQHGCADRTLKPQLYARSRIPYSLLLDHDSHFVIADMIIGGRYHEYASAAEGATLRVEEPFPLEIDLAAVCDGASGAPTAR